MQAPAFATPHVVWQHTKFMFFAETNSERLVYGLAVGEKLPCQRENGSRVA